MFRWVIPGEAGEVPVPADPAVVPTRESQFTTGQLADAAAKRSVCPTTQAVSTPPPEQPYTYIRDVVDVPGR